MISKIAVLGSDFCVEIFKTAGVDVYVEDVSSVESRLKTLMHEYSLILISDVFIEGLKSVIDIHRESIYPIILPIPSIEGKNEDSAKRIVDMIKGSLGLNIRKDNTNN